MANEKHLLISNIKMQAETILTTDPEIVFRDDFDGFGILYKPSTGETYNVNSTGISLWRAIDGKSTAGDIIDRTAKNFTLVSASDKESMIIFLESLYQNGLIHCAVGKL